MASSSRATPMKAHSAEERTAVDHRDRDTIGKDSTTSSKRRKDVESSRKHRRKPDDSEREEKEQRSHVEKRSRHRSRSRQSRQDHYPESREHRDHRTEHETSRSTTQTDRAYHRDHYPEHQSSRYDGRGHREHHEDENRSGRPVGRDHYSSSLPKDDHYNPRHKSDRYQTDSHRPDSELERRPRDDHRHQSKKHKHHDHPTSTRSRRSRSREKTSRPAKKVDKHHSSRSASPQPKLNPSTRDKTSRSSKRSHNQKSQGSRQSQVRKVAIDSDQKLSETPDHKESDKLNGQGLSKTRDRVGEASLQNTSPPGRKADSPNASINEAQTSDMNPGNHTPRHGPNPMDARQQYSAHHSQYVTPNHSHHGSPHSASPYGRGGWGGGYYAQQQQ